MAKTQELIQKRNNQNVSFVESNYSQTSKASSRLGKLQRGGGLTMQGKEFLTKNSNRVGLTLDMYGDSSTQASKGRNKLSRQQCQTARNNNMTPMID